MKTCLTCTAFNPIGRKNDDGSDVGECRAHGPVIVNFWNTPQGPGWQGGWPPISSNGWCREYQAKRAELTPVLTPPRGAA